MVHYTSAIQSTITVLPMAAMLCSVTQALREDIEQLKGRESGEERAPLKSALKRGGRSSTEQHQSTSCLASPESSFLELPDPGLKRRRNHSWGSGLTQASSDSSGTAYYSALEGSDEEGEDRGLVLGTTGREEVASPGEAAEVELLARLDDLMEGSKEQQGLALEQLGRSLKEQGENHSLVWRLCKAQYLCSVLENQEGNKEGQRRLILEAIQSGERALALDSSNSEAHKWFAIALGSRGEFGGVKEKILDGFEFKKHIDLAAGLNPRDHITQHLLGRFCYEVSQVTKVIHIKCGCVFPFCQYTHIPHATTVLVDTSLTMSSPSLLSLLSLLSVLSLHVTEVYSITSVTINTVNYQLILKFL